MADKVQQYLKLSNYAAQQITRSYKEWTGFLTTAGRLYKDICCKG